MVYVSAEASITGQMIPSIRGIDPVILINIDI